MNTAWHSHNQNDLNREWTRINANLIPAHRRSIRPVCRPEGPQQHSPGQRPGL